MSDHSHYSLFDRLMLDHPGLLGALAVYALAAWALWRWWSLPPGGSRKRTRNSAIILLVIATIGLLFLAR